MNCLLTLPRTALLRGLLACLLVSLLASPTFAGEAPAPEPAPKAEPAAPVTAEPSAAAEKSKPFLERLWKRVYDDFDRRFDVEQFAAIVRHLFDTAVVIFLAWLLIAVVGVIVGHVNHRMLAISATAARRRKVNTIGSLITSTIKYAVYIASVLWILSVWGVDTSSLVVGSAVIGAAVGFGSQGLVQDIITGLSILAEEQLVVGDYVEVAGKSGAVEEVGLRVIKLRDHLGVQHVIFNRTIGMVSNFTSGSVQAIVDISLESMSDAERAKKVATQVCRDLAHELPYFPHVPEVQGVQESSTKDVFLRLSLRVLPQQQQVIETLFVDRLKRALAVEKINVPEGRVRVVVISDLFTRALHKVEPTALPPSTGKDKQYEGAV
ncbi:MAG TPA: mechanosensitive ion channel family protein [Planctomycetota bacterium]|nr:mechanosensitive ion channel family protein [Planctomycetota bacterium]